MKTKNFKKPLLRSQFQHDPTFVDREKVDSLSQTVPDQSFSIREILTKHSKGLPIPAIAKVPVFSEEELPDFQAMDLTEIQAYREHLQTIITESEEKIHLANKAKEKQHYDEEIERRVKQRTDNVKKDSKGEESTV